MFDHLFQLLHPNLLHLFPSTRMSTALASLPPNSVPPTRHTEALDQPVWQFLAALALHATNDQQQALVTALREKVLENVASANKGWVADEDERRAKLGNVNLFLHALGLDSSQISI
jgi:DNA topoisomerase 2-associated protein PAT1